MTMVDMVEAIKLYDQQAKIKLDMRAKFTSGDCMTHYDVTIVNGGSLREFIEYIFAHPFHSQHYGHLGIKKELEVFGDPCIEFNKGKRDTSNKLFESYLDRQVVGVEYSGGYTRSDWIFEVEQLKGKVDDNKSSLQEHLR